MAGVDRALAEEATLGAQGAAANETASATVFTELLSREKFMKDGTR